MLGVDNSSFFIKSFSLDCYSKYFQSQTCSDNSFVKSFDLPMQCLVKSLMGTIQELVHRFRYVNKFFERKIVNILIGSFNSFLASGHFGRPLIAYANSLYPGQDQHSAILI